MALLQSAAGLYSIVANNKAIEETNAANYRMQQSANQTNIAIADKMNAANKDLAELAYSRSLPVQQVNNMMDAGMSRGAAIRALSGGGSYTAPVMQGATVSASQNMPKHFDPSVLSSAFERIANIPMVKQQMDINNEQLNKLHEEVLSLQADKQLKANQERRAQEEHISSERDKLYSHEENKSYDLVRTDLDAAIQENGLSYDDIKSRGDMFRLIGNKDSWKHAKGNAISRVFTDITQNRDNLRNERAADDKHKLDQETLKRLRADLADFNAEKDARIKEYKARAIVADIAYQSGVDKKTLMDYSRDLDFMTDENGNLKLKFTRERSERAKRFWERVADTIGIGVLKDLLGAIRLVG